MLKSKVVYLIQINLKRGGTTYDFATSNIIWRATLESLDFVPLTICKLFWWCSNH